MITSLLKQAIEFMDTFLQTEYDLWVAALQMPDDSFFKFSPDSEEVFAYQSTHPNNKNYEELVSKLRSYMDSKNQRLDILVATRPFDLTKEGFEEDQEWLERKAKRIIYVVQHYIDNDSKDLFYFYTSHIDPTMDFGLYNILIVQHDGDGFKIIKELTRCALCRGFGIYQAKLKDNKTEERTCPGCAGSGFAEGRQNFQFTSKLIETKAIQEPGEKHMEFYNKLIKA